MNRTTGLTISQRIILAAERLEAKGHTPFSAEALAVSAWQESPRTFGLKGFAEAHPDVNKVLYTVMGEKGLARRGWLEKRGQKLYSLSRQGKDEARRLRAGEASTMPAAGAPLRRNLPRIKVPQAVERHLVGLFTTAAFRRYGDGMMREITYADACRFWGLSEAAVGAGVDAAVGSVPATIGTVSGLLVDGTVELANGQSVDAGGLNDLSAVHRFLTDQFARHLEQQRKATVRTFRRIG